MSQAVDPVEIHRETSPLVRTAGRSERSRTAPPLAERKASTKVHAWVKSLLHVIRRTHLYGGLLLLPWVFLYGATGFLFNHRTFLPDSKIIEFGRHEIAGTPLEEMPTAAKIAEQIVTAINGQGSSDYKIAKPEAARFDRGGLSATIKNSAGETFNVLLDPKTLSGSIRESREPAASPSDAPFAVRRGMELMETPTKLVAEGLPELLGKVGLNDATVAEVRLAPVVFLMEGDDGRTWQVNYNAQFGSLTGQIVDANKRPDLSARSFLLRLHTAHHYPAEFNMRWIWAVIVDVMALLMVFWGISGIVMWWQIKRTRWLGAALLAISLLAAVWIGSGMHELMLANGGR